jgi:hypothetical protein
LETPARHLIFHGAIVLLFGLLMGGPYARAINRGAPAKIVHSWQVAHASIPIGATVMLAVGSVLSATAASQPIKWFIAVSLIVSSYAFCFSLPLAATVGHRGLAYSGPMSAKFVFAGNLVGALGSALAAIGFIYAAYVSL